MRKKIINLQKTRIRYSWKAHLTTPKDEGLNFFVRFVVLMQRPLNPQYTRSKMTFDDSIAMDFFHIMMMIIKKNKWKESMKEWRKKRSEMNLFCFWVLLFFRSIFITILFCCHLTLDWNVITETGETKRKMFMKNYFYCFVCPFVLKITFFF